MRFKNFKKFNIFIIRWKKWIRVWLVNKRVSIYIIIFLVFYGEDVSKLLAFFFSHPCRLYNKLTNYEIFSYKHIII